MRVQPNLCYIRIIRRYISEILLKLSRSLNSVKYFGLAAATGGRMARKPTFRGQRWIPKRRLTRYSPPDAAASPEYCIRIQKVIDLNLFCYKPAWRSEIDHSAVGVLYSIDMYRWRPAGRTEGILESRCHRESQRTGLPHQQSKRTQSSGLCSNVSDLLICCVNSEWTGAFWFMRSPNEAEVYSFIHSFTHHFIHYVVGLTKCS